MGIELRSLRITPLHSFLHMGRTVIMNKVEIQHYMFEQKIKLRMTGDSWNNDGNTNDSLRKEYDPFDFP